MNNKEKVKLKKEAHALKASYQIGKLGISKSNEDAILDLFNQKELIKIKVLESCPINIKEVVDILISLNLTVLSIIGNVILIYKKNNNEKK